MNRLFAVIKGIGAYLPDKILNNNDFTKMVDTSDEWILSHTGIRERRIAADDEYTSDLASKAALEAIKDAGISAEAIDLIITATATSDMYCPSTSCLVQKNIGAVNAAAFDVSAACSGFIYAVTVANQFIQTGCYNNVLVIGADCLSKVTQYEDRNTCVLFGDGAGAFVLGSSDKPSGILGTSIGAKGAAGDVLTIPGIRCDDIDVQRRPYDNKRTIWMHGTEVYKFAVNVMANESERILRKLGMTIDDIALVVPHQANLRIVEGAAKRLKCTMSKIFTNIDKYGNMSGASIPVALYEAIKSGRAKIGDNILTVGFGGGLTWGSAVIKL